MADDGVLSDGCRTAWSLLATGLWQYLRNFNVCTTPEYMPGE